MSDSFKSFPQDRFEALTMLYLQNQDLSDKSPSDIYNLYVNALSEIKTAYRRSRKKNQ